MEGETVLFPLRTHAYIEFLFLILNKFNPEIISRFLQSIETMDYFTRSVLTFQYYSTIIRIIYLQTSKNELKSLVRIGNSNLNIFIIAFILLHC